MKAVSSKTIALGLLLVPGMVYAEQSESIVAAEAVMLMPAHDPDDPTTFAQTAFGMRLSYAYGLTDDLAVVARGTSWLHRASIDDVSRQVARRGNVTGTLRAGGGEGYRGDVGLRYNGYAGYDLAPYLELYGGYQWTTYRDASVQQPGEAATQISDFAEGSATVSVGVCADYRLVNTVFVGLSVHGTRVLSGIYGSDVTVSAKVAYFWF